MARTTVSFPDALKARMDAAENAAGKVNWSALAVEAFEHKVTQIETRSVPPMMTKSPSEVAERLRASFGQTQEVTEAKQAAEARAAAEADERLGHAAGVAWAENEAEAPELETIASVLNATICNTSYGTAASIAATAAYADFGAKFFTGGSLWPATPVAPRRIPNPEPPPANYERRFAIKFWKRVWPDDDGRPSDARIRGFMTGAAFVYEQAKKLLRPTTLSPTTVFVTFKD